MTEFPARFDVVIAGGGQVGLALALGLARAVPGLRLAVAEPLPWHQKAGDPRAFAIAPSARRMLGILGVWEEIAPLAQPITDMIVTDSRTGDAIRPTFLTFSEDDGDGALAYMVPIGALIAALGRAAEAAGVVMLAPEAVADFDVRSGSATVTLTSGRAIAASLIVAADGARSSIRSRAGIAVNRWSYGQSGIVTTVVHEQPHQGRAEEHFLPAGPFAILPLADGADGTHRSSLVWTEETAHADRLVASDDMLFDIELERRFGNELGAIQPIGRRAAYPLGLTLARRMVGPRVALVGDAAHAIHPIAGQGLNLGFKDVAALVEVLANALRLGRDPGAIDVIEAYQRWRLFDVLRMAAVTDGLNRLFSNDIAPVRMLRDVGLGLVDRLPPARRLFAGAAIGGRRGEPRLLTGRMV